MRLSWFLWLLSFPVLCFAQEENISDYYDQSTITPPSISEADLERYKSNKDFDYSETIEDNTVLDRIILWLENILTQFWEAIFGIGSASGFLYVMFKIVPYALLAVLVFLLIRFFLKVNSNSIIGNTKEDGSVSYSEEEQIIKNEDINVLISEAIEQKNFRLAIRYYYLLSLKYLSEKSTIDWQPQKTNEDYIKEIEDPNIQLRFKDITTIYDYVWYGEFGVDAFKFEMLKLPFVNLNKSLQ